MFVERITRYNFDMFTEYDDFKKYSEMLGKEWYPHIMGEKIISLVHHVCEEYEQESKTDFIYTDTDSIYQICEEDGQESETNKRKDIPADEMTLEQARQCVKDLRKILVLYLNQKFGCMKKEESGE